MLKLGGSSSGAPAYARSNLRSSDAKYQDAFLRQCTILRKNLLDHHDSIACRSPYAQESYPAMLGRMNAALNQAKNLDAEAIDDVLEHFVYIPKRCTANPGDMPNFLSTRIEESSAAADAHVGGAETEAVSQKDEAPGEPASGDGEGRKKRSRLASNFGESPEEALRRYQERCLRASDAFEKAAATLRF
eukprot:CAMPEP_0194266908 /NCGR_PEP_ID=MMETSP0169-20130528/1645_1 /TAXON_ID=218684 /ORGANISM="Corethron pennatum, Strain L29A3" /LENGTH=188 /DNA_ID=CAMNT_0039007683 /DNA_START=27 /DNA_END=593 /DNA_ORIENTATION=+